MPTLQFGRETTGGFDKASRLEWLVANGLGGYAAGTVAGANTRRYHGLLVAALTPPTGRTVLVGGLHAVAKYAATGRHFALACAEWEGGTVAPDGQHLLEAFWLENSIPCWRYRLDNAALELRVFMAHGSNTTYCVWRLAEADGPVTLDLRPLCTYRDFHSETHGAGWALGVTQVAGGARVDAFPGAAPYWVRSDRATFEHGAEWYWNFLHRVERERGLDDTEDLYAIGWLHATLEPGESLTVVLTADENASTDGEAALAAEQARQRGLLAQSDLETTPQAVQQLVLAADQFVVARPSAEDGSGQSVIAGYPWFSDWGRDTMIALPGLTLAAGRADVAARILRTFSRYIDQGMLPNRFPDAGETPEYNTVDATLWYFEAVRAYVDTTGDLALARDLFPILTDIIRWHMRGTRYGIRMDERDGLLAAGEPGVQLTWMDAKVGDWVVTPRMGKPVEVNSLWINALRVMADLQGRLAVDGVQNLPAFAELAAQAATSFGSRFWFEAGGYLYDVIDAPGGADAALRPNQLFAVSLPHGPLAGDEQRERAQQVVDVCARHLYTSHGLRSLSPDDPAYTARYGGGPLERDGAYHQGTVWGWLLGPFVEAHFRVYGDTEAANALLAPILDHLRSGCAGTLSEIFDGDPPHPPRGCFAQAWTVAEALRVWRLLNASGPG